MLLTLFCPILEAQGCPREAQDLPKEAQEVPRGLQKWVPEGTLFYHCFLTFFFFIDFLIVFLKFFCVILSTFLLQLCYHWFMKILIFICVFSVEIDIPLFMERALQNNFMTKLEGKFDQFLIDFFDGFWDGFWYQKSIKIDEKSIKIDELRGKIAKVKVKRPKRATKRGKSGKKRPVHSSGGHQGSNRRRPKPVWGVGG